MKGLISRLNKPARISDPEGVNNVLTKPAHTAQPGLVLGQGELSRSCGND